MKYMCKIALSYQRIILIRNAYTKKIVLDFVDKLRFSAAVLAVRDNMIIGSGNDDSADSLPEGEFQG